MIQRSAGQVPSAPSVAVASAVALALAFAPVRSASAEPLAAWDTAVVKPRGGGSIGIVAPLRVALKDGFEVETHPLLFVVGAPNVAVRARLADDGVFRVTGEYGVSAPTLAMRFSQGALFPKWDTSNHRVGWFVVPSVGVVMSYGRSAVATARFDTAFGLGFGRNDATPLDTYAPLELLFAPALNGLRTRAGLAYDFPITSWLRGRAGIDVYYVGRSPEPFKSPLYVVTQFGVDIRVGKMSRLSLGAAWYDYDQRRTVVRRNDSGFYERVGVRSDDFYPTGDFVWAW